jgi:hypothetical protein
VSQEPQWESEVTAKIRTNKRKKQRHEHITLDSNPNVIINVGSVEPSNGPGTKRTTLADLRSDGCRNLASLIDRVVSLIACFTTITKQSNVTRGLKITHPDQLLS